MPLKIFYKNNGKYIRNSIKLISEDIDYNISYITERFSNCPDIVFKKFQTMNSYIYVVYIKSLIDDYLLINNILRDLSSININSIKSISHKLPLSNMKLIANIDTACNNLLFGNVLFLLNGESVAISTEILKSVKPNEPNVEPTLVGPKESFTHDLEKNIYLIRKHIQSSELKIQNLTLGRYSKTKLSILYIEGLYNKKILSELIRRLNNIDIDIVLDVSNVSEFIDDAPYSPFPTTLITERTDKVSACLLEGQISVLIQNSPFALVLPFPFMSFFQSPDDYYKDFYLGTIIRCLRYIGYFLSIFLPSIYVAVTSYNLELIPTKLVLSLMEQKQNLPFPSAIETFGMLIAFEILRELGVRLPKQVGPTVSLIGALIISDTAVRAGIISPFIIIIVALTVIGSMIVPSLQLYQGLLICRLLSLALGSIMGFWGVLLSALLILGHISSINTFGIPYIYPLAPFIKNDIDDILIRAPIFKMKKRPKFFSRKNLIRQK